MSMCAADVLGARLQPTTSHLTKSASASIHFPSASNMSLHDACPGKRQVACNKWPANCRKTPNTQPDCRSTTCHCCVMCTHKSSDSLGVSVRLDTRAAARLYSKLSRVVGCLWAPTRWGAAASRSLALLVGTDTVGRSSSSSPLPTSSSLGQLCWTSPSRSWNASPQDCSQLCFEPIAWQLNIACA